MKPCIVFLAVLAFAVQLDAARRKTSTPKQPEYNGPTVQEPTPPMPPSTAPAPTTLPWWIISPACAEHQARIVAANDKLKAAKAELAAAIIADPAHRAAVDSLRAAEAKVAQLGMAATPEERLSAATEASHARIAVSTVERELTAKDDRIAKAQKNLADAKAAMVSAEKQHELDRVAAEKAYEKWKEERAEQAEQLRIGMTLSEANNAMQARTSRGYHCSDAKLMREDGSSKTYEWEFTVERARHTSLGRPVPGISVHFATFWAQFENGKLVAHGRY